MALKKFPEVIKFKNMLGPSFIILALGLGSGEVILWPYLVSNYGLGVAWGALLGVSFQFFINMEISRYALVKGESVFVGIARYFPKAVYWFIISTFAGFGLPGIVAASAQVFAQVFGLSNFKWLAIILLLIIGFILTFGRTVYGMMERITKLVILIGVPFIFILAVYLSSPESWLALGQGLVGKGEGFWFLAPGIAIGTFLGAFAFSGAGGNLNLTQSIYVKEKGYGMGAYSQKITGLFASKSGKQKISLDGEDFEVNEENVSRFKKWWKLINLEHLLVFWLIGLISMVMLMFLAYNTVYGLGGNAEGINFVIQEAAQIGILTAPWLSLLFLVVIGVMLFQTQLGSQRRLSEVKASFFLLFSPKYIGSNLAISALNFSTLFLRGTSQL